MLYILNLYSVVYYISIRLAEKEKRKKKKFLKPIISVKKDLGEYQIIFVD